MPHYLTPRDRTRLAGVHPDLVKVVERAAQLTTTPFAVIEGMRTVSRQRELVKKGASKTMNSRHLTGHAVDIVPLVDGKVSWTWSYYYPLAKTMKQAAKEVGVPLEWGGDWKNFKDGPHWQLPWKHYGKAQVASLLMPAEVTEAPPYTDETDAGSAQKAVTVASGGVLTGASIAAEPIQDAVSVVTYQQGELTSGDWARMAVAVVIVGATLWFAWRKTR